MAADNLKRLARRAPTPVPGGRETGGTHCLPDELLRGAGLSLRGGPAVVADLWRSD